MQIIHRDELYTEKEQYVVMTRITVCEQSELATTAGHRRRGEESVVFSMNVFAAGKESHDDQAF